MSSFDLCYVIAAYFFVIMIFGGDKYRIHSAIIFFASSLNVIFTLPESTSVAEYVYNRNVSVLWDSATMLILVMFLMFDKIAWKQALLLVFATVCHIMIILHLTKEPSIISLFFYSFYDELIIITGILQMMVSHNGITTALRNIRKFISWVSFNIWCISKSFHSLKAGGKRT